MKGTGTLPLEKYTYRHGRRIESSKPFYNHKATIMTISHQNAIIQNMK